MKYKIIVPGKPQAKQRPRVTRSGFAFTPKETVMYENLVKVEFERQGGQMLHNGAIRATINNYFPVPKSASKKAQALMLEGKIPYTKKSDCDNLAKSVLDALNGIAYHDDAQVSELHVTKGYAETPRVEIILEEIN